VNRNITAILTSILIACILGSILVLNHEQIDINARLQIVETKSTAIETDIQQLKARDQSYNDTELKQQLRELADKVAQYEQDVKLWNRMTGELFGAENVRYFREGRGK
jgi:tryptophan 2,3-dioxygenase